MKTLFPKLAITVILVLCAAGCTSTHTTYDSHHIASNVEKLPRGKAGRALRNAQELRLQGRLNQASAILAPFSQEENAAILRELGYIQYDLGDYRTARAFARQAQRINQDHFATNVLLGHIAFAEKRFEDAERFYQKAKKQKDKPDPLLLNQLGLTKASLEKFLEAESLFKEAIILSPQNSNIKRNLKIAQALLQTHGPRAPAPAKKPKPSAKDKEENAEKSSKDKES